MTDDTPKPKSRRGFAGMSQEKRTEIARKGGAASPPETRAFAVNRDLARAAGRKGGQATVRNRQDPPTDG